MIHIATLLPPNSYLVRFHSDAETPYHRMTVVTVEGEELYMRGWLGPPLTSRQWRAALADLFPNARTVRYERRNLTTMKNRLVEHHFLTE